MEAVAAWCGFVGAWALVAGPVYQGVVELGGQDADLPAVRSEAAAIQPPRPVSPWWWLLPPVACALTLRRQGAWRRTMTASLAPGQRARFVAYSNKATGWFVVGLGAALIGVEQALDLTRTLGWPGLATLPLVALAAGASLAFTLRRLSLSRRALAANEDAVGSGGPTARSGASGADATDAIPRRPG